MKLYVSLGLVCSLLLVFFAGICIADEVPGSIMYIQGGESSITAGLDGEQLITVQDVIPYFHISVGNKNYLEPVSELSGITYPLNAALVFSGGDSESVSLVEIFNLSLSDEGRSLLLQVKPLEFYEGSVLKTFEGGNSGLDTIAVGNSSQTGVYIEVLGSAAENADECGSCQGGVRECCSPLVGNVIVCAKQPCGNCNNIFGC